MSIGFQLIRSLTLQGERNSNLKPNLASAKEIHISCRNIHTRKLYLKLPQTQLLSVLKGSLSLQSPYRFSRQFCLRSEAQGWSVSDKSFEKDDGGGKKMMMISSLRLPDVGKNVTEFRVRQTEGPGIGDGNDQGGRGQGGNGGGRGDENNSSDGNGGSGEGLVRTIWWLVAQSLRILRFNRAMWTGGSPEFLWLGDIAADFLAANLILSTEIIGLLGPSACAVAELLKMTLLDQIIPYIVILPLLPLFLVGMESFMSAVACTMFGGFVVIAAGLSLALLSLPFSWCNNNIHDDNDDDYGDYCQE